MIARDSKSYPYLAIAQHYNVPYAEVLNYDYKNDIVNAKNWKDVEWKYELYKLQCNIK